MKTYNNGPYSVNVESDGAIKVKLGDSLSKYSAAIHNDFWHVDEYGRKNRQGIMERITSANPIRIGETIYYLPTYEIACRQAGVRSNVSPIQLSSESKKLLIRAFLKDEFKLGGEKLEAVEKVYEFSHITCTAGEVLEIIGALEIVGVAGAGVALGLQVVSGLLLPVVFLWQVLEALELSERMYSMRAIAYTVTAWAFDQEPPKQSEMILNRLKNTKNTVLMRGHGVKEHEDAWNKAVTATITKLDSAPAKFKIKEKKTCKKLLRFLGNDDPAQLCKMIMEAVTDKLPSYPSTVRQVWRDNYTMVIYPY